MGIISVILISFGLGLTLYSDHSSLPPVSSEQSQLGEDESVEQPQPNPSSAVEPDQIMDEGWTTVTVKDPLPSLAAPRVKNMDFAHRIALTFDDGPNPATTPTVLDFLREHKLKATFFVVGRNAERYPELIKRIVDEGHTLGNHTYDHANLAVLSPEMIRNELQDTQTAVDEALGYHYPIRLVRPPYGAPYTSYTQMLPTFQQIMLRLKMYPVLWNIDPSDYALSNQPDLIVDNIARTTPASGGVLLLHGTKTQTVAALPRIINYYQASGYRFSQVCDLLAEKYGVQPTSIQDDLAKDTTASTAEGHA